MPFKLVTSNIDAMKRAIDLENLSPTFRDAVAVCRHLGLRYLWIDSLCIVQDSAQDWRDESSRMHSVYSNAMLNICGIAADPRGLFIERKNEHVHTGPIQVDWDGVCQGVYFCMLKNVWFDEVYYSPLNRRGWVLQERLLSQRNLLFGENQLFWECQQQTACELTPDGFEGKMRPEPYTQKVLSLKHGKATVYDEENDEDNSLSSYAIWDMIVDKYSNSDLTFGADRLIAVSALARHCQTHLGLEGEYLAGIWSRYIPYQLLWETHPDLYGQRQRGYQAPTWSWVSMDDLVFEPCVIKYADERDAIIQVTDWKIDLVSADPYGQVSGGYITISCRLAKVVVCADTSEWDHPRYDLKVDLDCFIPTKGKFQKDTLFEGSSGALVVDLYQNLVVMPVRKDLFLERQYPCWHGLVLRPVEGMNGTFERLGKYTMRDDEALFEQAFADFDLRAEESGLEFESNGEDGKVYTVRIE
ncbi:hypothetical protein IFR05_016332 [Cadophora sp. M221]|nr:hypothetical protein IFR05_016332 [Cadophora sp. M221]